MLLPQDLKEYMKPQQIEIATQELLQLIDATSHPANEVINRYTRTHRYIGSKDRRLLTERVWQILRQRPLPTWLKDYIPKEEQAAIQMTAPTVLRANGVREQVQQQLLKEGIETVPTSLSPLGLILTKRINLQTTNAFQKGLVEIQDEASQLATLATNVPPHAIVLDYCAGAGGKSLCLAQIMKNQGKIVAHDVSKISLAKLQKRAQRAKATLITTTQKPSGLFDHVIVDAPCSGSGTIRRAPDAWAKLTPQHLKSLIKKQALILDEASVFVKEKGYLHYITCSIIQNENQHQMKRFLKKHPDFKLCHHQQWSPIKTGTDGFFLATFQRVSTPKE